MTDTIKTILPDYDDAAMVRDIRAALEMLKREGR